MLLEGDTCCHSPGQRKYVLSRHYFRFGSIELTPSVLSCVIDLVTATIPVFLLWNVQMKPQTKRVLDVIFCFGFVTAAMSIDRAATTTKATLETDSTCKMP